MTIKISKTYKVMAPTFNSASRVVGREMAETGGRSLNLKLPGTGGDTLQVLFTGDACITASALVY